VVEYCGDGIRNLAEECDGSDFGADNCTTLNFTSGSLGCTPSCLFNTTSCTIYSPPASNTTSCNLTDVNSTITTIKLNQERDTNMILILIPLVLGVFAMVGAVTLDKEHSAIKIALFLFAFVTVIIAAYLGSVIVGSAYPEIQNALGNLTYYGGIFTSVLVIYFLIYLFFKMVRHSAQEEDQMSY
jgi:hypothetical protein